MAVTRASKKRPEPRLPKPKEPRLLDVTGMRRDQDYARLCERVDLVEGQVADHGEGIAQMKADAAQWGGLNQRVKTLEDKPDPVVITTDGYKVSLPVWPLVLAFLVHDLAAGALIFGAYWYARGAGWV